MRLSGKIIRQIYEYWHKYCTRAHFKKFKTFNNNLKHNNDVLRLSSIVPGVYKFLTVYCDERLGHRLFEMGFIPGEEIIVIETTGLNGIVMVRIKGSKIALSSGIADKILLKRK
jgi:Fe2+ transport system protein FeoA